MKLRTSFVSNSSSGSFVVRINDFFDETRFITKEEENLLLNNGFKYTHCSHPEHIEYNKEEIEDGEISQNLFYQVICNEDEVIEFLLKNNIPFLAMTHYGHNYFIYEKDKEYMIWFPNYGAVFTTYFCDGDSDRREEFFERITTSKTFEKVPLSDWGVKR